MSIASCFALICVWYAWHVCRFFHLHDLVLRWHKAVLQFACMACIGKDRLTLLAPQCLLMPVCLSVCLDITDLRRMHPMPVD